MPSLKRVEGEFALKGGMLGPDRAIKSPDTQFSLQRGWRPDDRTECILRLFEPLTVLN